MLGPIQSDVFDGVQSVHGMPLNDTKMDAALWPTHVLRVLRSVVMSPWAVAFGRQGCRSGRCVMRRLVETRDGVISLSATVHVGRRDHYALATTLIARGPRRAVLIQRSSTLLLGPELGWDDESSFYEEMRRSITVGTSWYHIASLRGIERHLDRRHSSFPMAAVGCTVVVDRDGVAAVPGPGDVALPVKILPDKVSSASGFDSVGFDVDDFKVDRQIRLIAADLGDSAEALVVSDVGDQQLTIRVIGGAALTLIDTCLALYHRCPPLATADYLHCLVKSGELDRGVAV